MQHKKRAPTKVSEHFHVRESDLNGYGMMHGGSMLTRCDETAFLVAYQHAGGDCLTRAVYRARFHRPLSHDAPYTIHATIADVGRSSIWVQCTLESRNEAIMDAVFVFVAVDKKMRPVEVPALLLASDEEVALQKEMRRIRDALRQDSNP